MDVANASLYDGASALAEAVLMALRLKGASGKRILIPRTLHPAYRRVLQTIIQIQDISLEELAYVPGSGVSPPENLTSIDTHDLAAVIIPQPNFFGVLEDVDAITDFAHQHGRVGDRRGESNSHGVIKRTGQMGERGADIVCGEGQPLGVPLASGGPYFGFMCCRKALMRQLPGRIVGRTTDAAGPQRFYFDFANP